MKEEKGVFIVTIILLVIVLIVVEFFEDIVKEEPYNYSIFY